jgi:CheY-like chemotaxis protein
MDGRMPMMDGEQAARLIRDGGSAQLPVLDAQIPIIALTANASDHDRQRYLAWAWTASSASPSTKRCCSTSSNRHRPAPERAATRCRRPARRGRRAGAPVRPRRRRRDARGGGAVTGRSMAAPVHILPLAGLSPQHLQRIAQAFLMKRRAAGPGRPRRARRQRQRGGGRLPRPERQRRLPQPPYLHGCATRWKRRRTASSKRGQFAAAAGAGRGAATCAAPADAVD